MTFTTVFYCLWPSRDHEFLIFYRVEKGFCVLNKKPSSADEVRTSASSRATGRCIHPQQSVTSPVGRDAIARTSSVPLLLQSCSIRSQFVSKQLSLQLTWLRWDLWNSLTNKHQIRNISSLHIPTNWRVNIYIPCSSAKRRDLTTTQPKQMSAETNRSHDMISTVKTAADVPLTRSGR